MGQNNDAEWAARLTQEGSRFTGYPSYVLRDHYYDPDIGRLGLYTAPSYFISGGVDKPFSESMFENDANPPTNSINDPNVPPFPSPEGTGN